MARTGTCVAQSAALVALVVLAAQVAASAGREERRLSRAAPPSNTSRCGADPCTYKYYDKSTGMVYSYDFSSLCSDTDYELVDAAQHTYYANICGRAQHACRPATWQPTLKYGSAAQYWGSTPPCGSPPKCTGADGKPACCTADCQILGAGEPYMSLIDPANPVAGGVRMLIMGTPSSKSNPFWCPMNHVTHKLYARHVVYELLCDSSVTELAQPVGVQQNSTNDCFYTMQFKTARACGTLGPA